MTRRGEGAINFFQENWRVKMWIGNKFEYICLSRLPVFSKLALGKVNLLGLINDIIYSNQDVFLCK